MILSKTGSLYQQPNLFRFFLSTSSVLEHELKTHISDVLKTVYLLLMQIGCFHIYKKFLLTAQIPGGRHFHLKSPTPGILSSEQT